MGQLSYTTAEIDELLGKVNAGVVPMIGKGNNLFDNGRFVGGGTDGAFPVNQRGKSIYAPSEFGIDRWMNYNTGETISGDGLIISSTIQYSAFLQYIEEYRILEGNTYALSVIANDILFTWSFKPSKTIIWQPDYGWMGAFYPYCIWKGETGRWELSIATNADASAATQSITLKAAKLELGDQQTLAHLENGVWVLSDPPPNYGVELLKCQRYYQIYATQSLRPSNAADCRPVMRATPAQGTISIDGSMFYYNDANL